MIKKICIDKSDIEFAANYLEKLADLLDEMGGTERHKNNFMDTEMDLIDKAVISLKRQLKEAKECKD